MAQKKNNNKINNTNYQSRERRVENKGKIRFHKTSGPSPTARHFPASFCQPVLQIKTQLCSLDMLIVALSDLAALEEVNLSEQGKNQEYKWPVKAADPVTTQLPPHSSHMHERSWQSFPCDTRQLLLLLNKQKQRKKAKEEGDEEDGDQSLC